MSINLDGILGVSATGNITGNYIFGNGSQLTGIVTSNVDLGNISQNVIPSSNVTYSLGNSTNQWKDLWVSNNTIYLNSVPISLNSTNDLLVNNVPVVLSSNTAPPQTANIATTANIIAGNVVVSNATVGAGVVFADGTVQYTAAGSSNYGDSNVSAYLSSGVNANGFTTNGQISAFGNINAQPGAYFKGDGSQLTGMYGNANVEVYLPTSNTIIAINANIANTNSNVANNTANIVTLNATVANLATTSSLANTNANVANTDSNVANVEANVATLQGLVYGNANVAAYLPTYTGNLTSGEFSTTGNIVANGNVTGANFSTAGNILGGGNFSVTGNAAASNISTTGNVSVAGNVAIAGNISLGGTVSAIGNVYGANLMIGNGGIFQEANISTLIMTANIANNNTTVNVSDNGAIVIQAAEQLALGIGANTYIDITNAGIQVDSNIEARANIGTYNLAGWDTISGNTISATGNITANYFIGDGSQLTNINAANIIGAYGNANVEAYLPTSNTIIAINANIANTNSNVANTNSNVATNTNSISQLNLSVNEGANALANTNANVANLQSQVNALPVINTIPSVYLTAVANGNGQVFSNVILGSYTSNTSMTVFYNGALLENTFYELAGDVLTVNTYLNTGDNIDVITTLASNVNNVTSGYGNSNVALFFNDYAGNINPATNNAYTLGDPANVWATIYATDISVANTVTSTLFVGNFQGNITGNLVVPGVNGEVLFNDNGNAGGDTGLTFNKTTNDLVVGNLVTANSFLGNGMTINGNVFITGNANIQGNLTYTNITNLTTDNLVLGLGNNQTGINVTGGGIAVGNTNEATLLYNFTTQTWDSNLGINAVGNITAPYFIGDGSQLTGLPASYGNANVAAYLPTYTGDLTANNATFTGTVTADGNTNGTAFAVVGNGAQSNVALGFFPTGATPAQMAIRDYSTVTSTMYFDASAGGSANGLFNFRTSNAFTSYATIASTGLTVNSTQTSNTNINSTIYYNTGTSQYTAGPSMAAFASVSAPFSGNITSAITGHWIQAQGNIVLPDYTTVPIGTTFTITNSASGSSTPMKVSVFNQSADFLYYPPQYSTTNRFIELFFGQWIQVISRGTGEWDVIASNVNAPQKVWAANGQNVALAMDLMNFRYNGNRFQFSPVTGSFTVFGQTLTLAPGAGPRSDSFTSGTYTAGTWYDLTGVNITISGSTAEAFLTQVTGGYSRMYRATCMVDSTNLVYISIERLFNSTV